ncbi:MAG: malto-oligosyltrehalose trehalohydrolase [Ornithinibacter sp.]
MTHIEVWAPLPETVEIQWSRAPEAGDGPPGDKGHRDAMTSIGGGWWRWQAPAADDAGDGETTASPIDYAFVLDGVEPAVPDPRSPWQPNGIHAASRSFDASAFPWGDGDWRGIRSGAGVLGALIYELHIGTFTAEGTFDAAIDRLDHLVSLGVEVVEVMPIASFPGRWGWGYDGVGMYAVHDPYGGPLAFQRFVDACHARGLAVCVDVVHNHLGASGNYLARFGPYFTQAHETPWGPAVNLDQEGAPEVRAFLIDSALRWFRDFHVDALRLDAVHELKDDSPRHYLGELSDDVAALALTLGRPLDLIAESDLNDTMMVTPTAAGGRGMTAQWDDDLHHALHVTLTGERQGYYADFAGHGEALPGGGPVAVLAKVLTRGFLHDGTMSTFRGHPWGKPVDTKALDARRLVGYLQTHDQVGNRMVGDRISALLPPGLQAAGAALYLLGPLTPMLFMGEEWAASTPWQFFTSFEEDWLADAVRAGRRAEFGSHGWSAQNVPDPQDPATRDRSVLDWSELDTGPHPRMLRWYAACISARRTLLPGGPTRLADVEVSFDEDAGWVVMRHAPAGCPAYVVVVTLSATEQAVPVVGAGEVLLAWDEVTPLVGEDVVHLPATSVAVVEVRVTGTGTGTVTGPTTP